MDELLGSCIVLAIAALLLGVPVDSPAHLVGDVRQVAGRRRPVHFLDVRSGLLVAVVQAVQEVLYVSKMLLGAAMRLGFLPVPFGGDDPAAAVEREDALAAVKFHAMAAVLLAVVVHALADGIDEREAGESTVHVESVRRVAVVTHEVLAACGPDGQRRPN